MADINKPLTSKDIVKQIWWIAIAAIIVTAFNVILSGGAIIQSQRLAQIEAKNSYQDALIRTDEEKIAANTLLANIVKTQLDSMSGDLKDIKGSLSKLKQ